jgi:hypothetical protein
MLYFFYNNRISPTAMQLGSLEPVYDIYHTNYATRYTYLCKIHYLKIYFLLRAQKFRMTTMCDKKWIDMH